MKSRIFIFADEVAEQLNVSKSFAYKILKRLNDELETKGFITIQGRVSRAYYEEQIYGIKSMLKGEQYGDTREQKK